MLDSNFALYIFAFVGTFIITAVCEWVLIPRLKQRAQQPIYEGGPKWHVSKSGTPTMGGLAFLIGISAALLISALYLALNGDRDSAISLLCCLVYAILNSAIGIMDDCRKLKRKRNEGLTPIQKLLLQSLLAIGLLYARRVLIGEETTLSFSIGDIDIGFLYYPLAFLVLVGMTNCANITDGIDGLAAGVAFAVGVSLFYTAYALNFEVSFISSAIMGAATSFLIFNLHPAKIFMGDTGSLLLGALIASAGVALGNPLVILFIGGVYALEGASVILQVIWFKITGRRLFKMAPLHHHLEKSGWSENRICLVAIILTFICSIPAFIFYLP